jgi:hypothetical protein
MTVFPLLDRTLEVARTIGIALKAGRVWWVGPKKFPSLVALQYFNTTAKHHALVDGNRTAAASLDGAV